MTRVAIYARYSSDQQREASIEDQIRICRERAEREGWTVINCYTDHAISGASMMRPGIQMLLQDAMAGKLDIVLAEDLDRLSRDQEDIAGIYKRMQFSDVAMITLADGTITDLHIGLKGTMSARYLKDLAQKTHRGLRGRVEAGKSGGGNAYGYSVVKQRDSRGEPIRGEREINSVEAEIIVRIFREYVAGKSPRAIAVGLNKEGVPCPSGKDWGPSTIHGNRRRGTGILNNELYVGRLIWNRLRYVKDPDTGKRLSRANPENDWICKDVPALRIVDQALWDAVKAKQDDLEERAPNFWQKQRPKHLFSFVLKCGCCGSGFSLCNTTRYGCSASRNKGTCTNRLTISRDRLEAAVLGALQSHLMDPELCARFCEEYTQHMNRLRMNHTAALRAYETELARLEKNRQRLIQAIKDGVPGADVKDEMIAIGRRRDELTELIAGADEAPPLLHPNMAHRYREEVSQLVAALSDPAHRAEAADLLRRLIERITLSPNEENNDLMIDLHGDLAGILAIATNEKPPKMGGVSPSRQGYLHSEKDALSAVVCQQSKLVAGAGFAFDRKQDKMVAGTGFEPVTFRL